MLKNLTGRKLLVGVVLGILGYCTVVAAVIFGVVKLVRWAWTG